MLFIIKLDSLVIILFFTYLLPSYGHVQLQFRKMEPHQTPHIGIVHLWTVELMTELQNILLNCVTETKNLLYILVVINVYLIYRRFRGLANYLCTFIQNVTSKFKAI